MTTPLRAIGTGRSRRASSSFVHEWSRCRAGAAAARRPLTEWRGLDQTWRARQVERQYLETIGDLELHELGITRADALREARKPFWAA